MNASDEKSQLGSEPKNVRKPYVAPSAKRLKPAEAKELLLHKTDSHDPEVQSMLRTIEPMRVRRSA